MKFDSRRYPISIYAEDDMLPYQDDSRFNFREEAEEEMKTSIDRAMGQAKKRIHGAINEFLDEF